MPIYVTNEAQLDIPEGWDDQSIVAFVAPGQLPRIGVVITKQALQPGETPEAAVDLHLAQSARRLRRYELIERKTTTVGGLKGQDISFHFSNDGLLVYQRQVIVPYGALLWILTVSSVDSRRAEADQILQRALQSLKFRRPGGGP